MKTDPLYFRHRFPVEIISYAVWLYYRFSPSFRDVEELMAQAQPADVSDFVLSYRSRLTDG